MKGSLSSRLGALRGPVVGLVGQEGGTDYGGLGAPIDGPMSQQGPLSFIHSPSGPLLQVGDMRPAHISPGLHYKTVIFV